MATDHLNTDGHKVMWPVKYRELQNHHFDSTIWNDLSFRDDDIIIGTWGKSGTTWMQQIVSQLVFQGDGSINPHEKSPWLEMRIVPMPLSDLERQTHRRFIKTHLPLDALRYSQKAKYIYVARDGRDVAWSFHNHLYKATDTFYRMVNDTPGRQGPALQRPAADPVQFFRKFLESDQDARVMHCPFWENVKSWWNARELPNLLLVHFNDLKSDLASEVSRIAEFLDIKIAEEKRDAIIEHCTFTYMKANSLRMSPPKAELIWENGGDTFINKGSNSRWIDSLTRGDIAMYEVKARAELGEQGARWLAAGGHMP